MSAHSDEHLDVISLLCGALQLSRQNKTSPFNISAAQKYIHSTYPENTENTNIVLYVLLGNTMKVGWITIYTDEYLSS